MEVKKSTPEGIIARSLARTSPESWAETDKKGVDERGKVEFQGEKDRKGPISIATIVDLDFRQGNEAIKGSFVVYGDSDFIDNYHINLGGNKDLFLNTVSWLVGEENLISIGPKDIERGSFVVVTSGQAKLCFWLPLVVEPLLVLLIGITYCAIRKIREQ